MKLQFDANQQFQLDAIAAVTDLFEGQPQGAPEYAVINLGVFGESVRRAGTHRAGGRQPPASGRGQAHGQYPRRPGTERHRDRRPSRAAGSVGAFDDPANQARRCPHFSVEMETGTGKTYVYLRTIFELSRRYGFQKFIIVVPSVAIREGVLKNIEITAEHFRALYNNLPFEHFVYDAKKVNRLRQFATSNTLQILVINIDAFRKNFTGTEEEQKSNVIYKESDKLSGRQPIEFVQAARPIVIIDEPQSVDSTEKAQEAIKALNPLCTLRYSATHRNPYNLVYRLDPVRAFELKLVKQIVVASAAGRGRGQRRLRARRADRLQEGHQGQAAHPRPDDGRAEGEVGHRQERRRPIRPLERAGLLCPGLLGGRDQRRAGSEFIRFNNGRTLRLGEEIGGMREDVWRAQIKHTVKRHLEKELQVRERGIKVLSLFFIDRVANYRDYDGAGQPVKGKFAEAFEAELAALAEQERYRDLAWLKEPIEQTPQRLLRPGQKRRAQRHARRHPGRRRGLQPDHEGEGAPAVDG